MASIGKAVSSGQSGRLGSRGGQMCRGSRRGAAILTMPDGLARAVAAARGGDDAGAEPLLRAVLADETAPGPRVKAAKLLGKLLRRRGAWQEAYDVLASALPLAPRDPGIAPAMADCLLQLGQGDAALHMMDFLIARRPDLPAAKADKARLLILLGRNAAARGLLDEVLATCADLADAWALSGTLALDAGDPARAEADSRRALALNPALGTAFGNLGRVAALRGDVAAALDFYRKGAAVEPGNARLQYNLGLTELHLRNYAAGWRGYAWRHRVRPAITADFGRGLPRWQPGAAGRVLIWGEQGVGDEVLFSAMLPDAAAAGMDAVLLCDPRLVPLFARSFPGLEVLARDTPRDTGAQWQLPLGDLGAIFRPDATSFTRRGGHLKADPARRAALRARYGAESGQRLVGIAWRSANAEFGPQKSAALADFLPILRLPGFVFVNLQYGDCAAEIAALAAEHGIRVIQDPAIDPLVSLDDHAAQVAAMDQVVSVSNSAVHLAGALGVAACVMLPQGRGVQWYWGAAGERTDWYESILLLRAGPGEGLPAVIARAAQARLAAEVQTGGTLDRLPR